MHTVSLCSEMYLDFMWDFPNQTSLELLAAFLVDPLFLWSDLSGTKLSQLQTSTACTPEVGRGILCGSWSKAVNVTLFFSSYCICSPQELLGSQQYFRSPESLSSEHMNLCLLHSFLKIKAALFLEIKGKPQEGTTGGIDQTFWFVVGLGPLPIQLEPP